MIDMVRWDAVGSDDDDAAGSLGGELRVRKSTHRPGSLSIFADFRQFCSRHMVEYSCNLNVVISI